MSSVKKLPPLLKAGVVLSYASNLFSFQKCNLLSRIVSIYDCVPYCNGY